MSAIDARQALDEIAGWIDRDDLQYVCVTGVHGVMECQNDPELSRIHNDSGLTVPDGMPMVWLGRWAGATGMERVCGPDLMLELCELAAQRGWSNFFYGGAPGTPERLSWHLVEMYPGLRIAGTYSPPFRALESSEKEDLVALINDAAPDLIWVGLSTPKQERWMAEFRSRLSAPVLLGVGAAFDLHAGLTTRAPVWMQRTGLEWFYRLIQEPRRLWRRYLTNNPRFVMKVALRPPVLLSSSSEDDGRLRLKRGQFVVVVGPDGAGKTTVATELLQKVAGRYFHFRPPFRATNMSRVPPILETPREKEERPSPAAMGWLRLLRNFLSSWIGYLTAIRPSLKRGELVVADRWIYGYLVQPKPLRYSGPSWLARLATTLLPQPDLVVNVTASAELVHSRKDELDQGTIRSELQAWARLPVSNLISVENIGRPDEVAEQILTHLSRSK